MWAEVGLRLPFAPLAPVAMPIGMLVALRMMAAVG
jgi:hypothetical protein